MKPLRMIPAALILALLASCSPPAPPASEGAKAFRVAAVFQTAIEEPWDGVIHQACLKAKEELGVEYEFTEKVAAADYEKVLREYADRGFDLIVGDAFLAGEDPVRRVAKDYPEIAFAFGSEFGPAAPNLSVFDNWIHEPAYLCGVIAGKRTKTGTIGAVAALPIGEVNRLVNAFREGARSVRPDVKMKVSYIGSWFDPPKAKEAAIAQIEAGADLIFAERFGVYEACKEKGVLAFSNMYDQHGMAPETIITGPVWDMGPTIRHCIETVRKGAWVGMDLKDWSMMAQGGARLAPLHDFEARLPADVLASVRDLEAKIVQGAFRVPVDESKTVSD
ncbi:MAG TPA: BMP family protein [Kiritimatiellia bacterium]|nr:BMP family protein [Kiritimatiellia bacterium]HRZ12431.1 BMP family protein [Kiritimatiellia bacterium]HSA17811.1 BMP family protein [Kiritimatiellia bacterium]